LRKTKVTIQKNKEDAIMTHPEYLGRKNSSIIPPLNPQSQEVATQAVNPIEYNRKNLLSKGKAP